MKYTPAELVAVGHAFLKAVGRPPSRDDFRISERPRFEKALGFPLPGTHHFLQAFESWTEYLQVCGFPAEAGGLTAGNIERAAAAHCVKELGVTEETAERSITDGWLPDGRTVEIKGSVLRQHARTKAYFFGFRTHTRDLSVSADMLLLVGLGRDLDPLVRLEVPKAAIAALVDGKSNVTLYTPAVWGGGTSKYRRFVTWRLAGSEGQIITDHLAESDRAGSGGP